LCYVVDREGKYVEYWWNDPDREKTQVPAKIPIPLQFCPLQIQKETELVSISVISNYSLGSDRLDHENA